MKQQRPGRCQLTKTSVSLCNDVKGNWDKKGQNVQELLIWKGKRCPKFSKGAGGGVNAEFVLGSVFRNWIGKISYLFYEKDILYTHTRFSIRNNTWKYKNEEYKDSKIFTMGVNGGPWKSWIITVHKPIDFPWKKAFRYVRVGENDFLKFL